MTENHTNIQAIYKATKIWELKCIKCIDHKMKNLVAGLMSNASLYPCINCKASKHNLGVCGPERKPSCLANDFERFVEQGHSNRKLGKLFFCQVDAPLLYETLEEHKASNEKISDIIVPSCLHDWLGIANHFVHELGEIWPEVVAEWVKHAKVSAKGYWQGTFMGNALRDLFQDVSFLEDNFGNPKIPLMAPYINAIKSFDSVRESCYGMELHDDYKERILKFFADYKVLNEDFGVSILVKAHDLFFHCIDWIEKWQVSLGVVSENEGESLHLKFRKFSESKQLASPDSEDFGDNLLTVTIALNSQAAIDFD